ncbi:transcriptional regulator, LysR family [Sphingobium sp. YR657]|uniref:LysR substrate-binding domain-containing protein n=1 Tax=Sphingobium sp. YR657 TaxID=1884366 RepID=UPI00091749D8|nr:LysR substrate-binding domain-containing protein [Sphingobium sp. YR657]SHM45803.1 transcriptional regulator, LysR family [Sphingobium sp. YR657]
MPAPRSQLTDFSYFLAIAKHRSFRLAGLEMGLSPSAMSHALKGLEARLGVRLVNRTNRSVTLTGAGEELRNAIELPLSTIDQAVERLNRHRESPIGRIRINAQVDAAQTILPPVLTIFAERYPEIEVEIEATDRLVDITSEGFDAGIRVSGTVAEDMVVQRISSDLRWVVAGSPAYFDRFGVPEKPSDLKNHRCISGRLGDGRIYQWEFKGPDGEFSMPVPTQFIMGDRPTMLAMTLAGTGLMYCIEQVFDPYVRRGELQVVLKDWAAGDECYQIYYSSRRQVPLALRLLVELIREVRPLGL